MLSFKFVGDSGDGYAIVRGVTLDYLKEIIQFNLESRGDSYSYQFREMDTTKTGCMYVFWSGAKLYMNTQIGNIIQGYSWDGRDLRSACEELKAQHYLYLADRHTVLSRCQS